MTHVNARKAQKNAGKRVHLFRVSSSTNEHSMQGGQWLWAGRASHAAINALSTCGPQCQAGSAGIESAG